MNKKAPTLALQDMLALAIFLEKKALNPNERAPNALVDSQANARPPHTNTIFMFPKATSPPPIANGYIDPDLADAVDPEPPLLPTMETIESIVASLIEQDLLHGFISHSSHRFAITGAKNASPLQVGFPRVWDVLSARADKEVPGWVREEKKASAFGGKFGPGMVVNLSGARPAGAGPA
jgi:hypothetical protein